MIRARAAELQVGDMQDFIIKKYVNNTVNEQTFVLQYSGKHCNVWLEKADNWQITSEMVAELGAEFDVNIYDRMTAAFGPVYDLDGDGKVAIFLYDIQEGYVEGSGIPYIGGLFMRDDLTDDPEYNHMDALHIDTYPSIYSHGAYNLSKSKSTIAHEFQHLIEISATLTSNVVELPLWVNEGLSTAAEHMIYGPQENRISQYNEYVEPGDPLAEWDGNLSDYALSYLFFQYLRIQTQDFTGGGEALYRQIVQTGGTATQAIEQAIKQFYPYTNMDQIIRNFYIALTLNEDTGAYGFGGETPFKIIEPKFYTGSSINLRSGTALIKKGPISNF